MNNKVIWIRLFNGKKTGNNPIIGRAQEGEIGKVVFIRDLDLSKVQVGHFLKVEVIEENPTSLSAMTHHFYTQVPENTERRFVRPERIEEGHSFQAPHLSHAEKLFNDKLATLRDQHTTKSKTVKLGRRRRIRAFTGSDGRVHLRY